jgi:imidazole glycerol-phosphate synthase subunit HisH
MGLSETVVVDYGLGNLKSVAQALSKAGGSPVLASDPRLVASAQRIILPGVGAYPVAAQSLKALGLSGALVDAAQRGVPILGICLGMQLLFERGSEFNWTEGLSLIPGDVLPILDTAESSKLRATHIGWRDLDFSPLGALHPLFQGISPEDSFYFVHSYSAHAGKQVNSLATVLYGDGREILAAAAQENVMGVQFHPEKSGPSGLKVLENFLEF